MRERAAAGPALEGQSLGAFLAALASDRPAPGGGAAAAVALALGRALLAMAAAVAARRMPEERRDEFASMAAREADAARAALALAERDAAAFRPIAAAYALPRGTDAERAARRCALAAGARDAVREGEAAAAEALQTMARGRELAGAVRGSVAADARAGWTLACAALEIMLDNLEANAALLPGPEADDARRRAALLRAQARSTAGEGETVVGGA